MFNFNYDPKRQGYDTGLWKTISGAPSVSSDQLLFSAASAIQYADCLRGVFSFKVTVPATPASGYLTGGTSATAVIATWNAVTDGEFAITVDGTAHDVKAIDFSAAADMNAVAALIQEALRAKTLTQITCVWSTNKFIITGKTSVSVTSAVSGGTGTDISGAGATAFMDAETGRGTATAGTDQVFGLASLNKDVKAVFHIYGNEIRCISLNEKGQTETSVVPWVAAWATSPAVYQIKWLGNGFGFFINRVNVANHSNSGVNTTMSAYISNVNATNLLVGYVEGAGIESYL